MARPEPGQERDSHGRTDPSEHETRRRYARKKNKKRRGLSTLAAPASARSQIQPRPTASQTKQRVIRQLPRPARTTRRADEATWAAASTGPPHSPAPAISNCFQQQPGTHTTRVLSAGEISAHSRPNTPVSRPAAAPDKARVELSTAFSILSNITIPHSITRETIQRRETLLESRNAGGDRVNTNQTCPASTQRRGLSASFFSSDARVLPRPAE